MTLCGWQDVKTQELAALPIPVGVCNIFVCPNSGMAASVWEF